MKNANWPYCGHVSGDLFKTTDGGNNWETQIYNMTQLLDMYFLNESIGFCAGYYFQYTTDGGDTWNSADINMIASSLDVIDENNIWIAGYDDNEKGIIKSSIDGGLTWNKKLGDTIQLLNDITFIDSNNGWAVGDSGTILHTSDGGNDWEFQESGSIADLNSVYFVDENHGWICGDSTIILYTDNGGITGLPAQVQTSNLNVRCYPNPVSDNHTIEFEIVNPTRVSIQIYNNIGELLVEPNHQIYSTGQHQVNLNLIDLKDGIYFCRIQIGNERVTKKIIKL